MKVKLLYGLASAAFIAVTQLLFFWLLPVTEFTMSTIYPFYAVLTVSHTVLLYLICLRYKFPACLAPALAGSIITIADVVGSILLGLFCTTARTIIFAESITIVVYIFFMALLIGIASKESVDSDIPYTPVRAYATNPPPELPCSYPGQVSCESPFANTRPIPFSGIDRCTPVTPAPAPTRTDPRMSEPTRRMPHVLADNIGSQQI